MRKRSAETTKDIVERREISVAAYESQTRDVVAQIKCRNCSADNKRIRERRDKFSKENDTSKSTHFKRKIGLQNKYRYTPK